MRVVFDINVYVQNAVDDESVWPEIEPIPPATGRAAADCVSIAFDGVDVRLFLSPHIIENTIRILAHLGHTDAGITIHPTMQKNLPRFRVGGRDDALAHFRRGCVDTSIRIRCCGTCACGHCPCTIAFAHVQVNSAAYEQ